jgi:hypothetical protein
MKWLLSVLLVMMLSACATSPPSEPDNICSIFFEKSKWYKKARKSQKHWGTPIPVMMAITKQESGFKARARPPRKKILGFIPGPRPASAYGYSQATNETWDAYKKSTGRWTGDRNNFGDAMDFIGWYNDQSNRRNGISKTDAYNLYLAYHEGQGGYKKASYKKKQWLKDVARKVASQSATYSRQLKGCEKKLNRGWFFGLF